MIGARCTLDLTVAALPRGCRAAQRLSSAAAESNKSGGVAATIQQIGCQLQRSLDGCRVGILLGQAELVQEVNHLRPIRRARDV